MPLLAQIMNPADEINGYVGPTHICKILDDGLPHREVFIKM